MDFKKGLQLQLSAIGKKCLKCASLQNFHGYMETKHQNILYFNHLTQQIIFGKDESLCILKNHFSVFKTFKFLEKRLW